MPELPTELSSFKYFAFISYSRRDDRAAKWLQKRLEWFSIPVKLVEHSRRPPHQRYLRPIYRDKTNLEVDHAHYWENIKSAIEHSRFLIELCSPHSAALEPVNLEVDFLKVRGSIECLVPVVLEGRVASQGRRSLPLPRARGAGGRADHAKPADDDRRRGRSGAGRLGEWIHRDGLPSIKHSSRQPGRSCAT